MGPPPPPPFGCAPLGLVAQLESTPFSRRLPRRSSDGLTMHGCRHLPGPHPAWSICGCTRRMDANAAALCCRLWLWRDQPFDCHGSLPRWGKQCSPLPYPPIINSPSHPLPGLMSNVHIMIVWSALCLVVAENPYFCHDLSLEQRMLETSPTTFPDLTLWLEQ